MTKIDDDMSSDLGAGRGMLENIPLYCARDKA